VNKIGGWFLYFAGLAAILFIGWNEPLHYRFLTPQDIQKLEHPVSEQPVESGTPTPTQSKMIGNPVWRTSLDKGAH